MNKYIHYGPKDFALDKDFQKWVISPDEESDRFWTGFRDQHPAKGVELDKAVKLVRKAGLSADPEANAYFLEVWGALDANSKTAKKAQPGLRRVMMLYGSLAASFIGLMVLVFYFLGTGGNWTEHKTAYGEIRKVNLPDGSVVTLNSNSVIRVASDFTDLDDRRVYLEGEAFFEVEKFRDKTFTVETAREVGVKVLGTKFNVNTRHETVNVYLQSGKVSLFSSRNSIILNPGESAGYDTTSGQVFLAKVPAATQQASIAWREGLYIMNDKPLSEIFADIEDNFGVKVIAQENISDRRVTAKIPAGDLDLLMKVLSETLEMKMERKSNQVVVSSI